MNCNTHSSRPELSHDHQDLNVCQRHTNDSPNHTLLIYQIVNAKNYGESMVLAVNAESLTCTIWPKSAKSIEDIKIIPISWILEI